MKPYSLALVSLTFFAVFGLAGCRKEKSDPQGEKLVSSRPPLPLSDIRPEDAQAQSLLSQKLIATSLKLSGKLSDMVDTLTPTVLLTTLLNAAENETSEKLIKSIGIHEGRQDKFTKSIQAQLDHLRKVGPKEVKFNYAFWMIWPILLTPDFQQEIGEKLGVSVYRLGNDGLTAEKRIQDWGNEFSPERTRFKLDLDKKDVMLVTAVCRIYPRPKDVSISTTFMGHDIHFIKMGEAIEAIKIIGPDSESLLGKLNFTELRKTAKPKGDFHVPPVTIINRNEHQKVLEAAGFGYIFEDSNDLRYMAMELRSNGISKIVSFSGVRWRSSVIRPPEPKALVLLWAPDSGLVLGGGKGFPIPGTKL